LDSRILTLIDTTIWKINFGAGAGAGGRTGDYNLSLQK
jgi:hypothetical protein